MDTALLTKWLFVYGLSDHRRYLGGRVQREDLDLLPTRRRRLRIVLAEVSIPEKVGEDRYKKKAYQA
jgi:hypothetical protein